MPVEMPIGNDGGGRFGSPDGTRQMELAKYADSAHRKADAPLPSPDVLAREYLRKAGFAPTELDDAAAILKAADGNVTLEKVFTATK